MCLHLSLSQILSQITKSRISAHGGWFMSNNEENNNKISQSHYAENSVQLAELQAEMAKAQVEIAKIQAETQGGWQQTITQLAELWQKHSAQQSRSEHGYTLTLTWGILIFLLIIVGTLATLTWRGLVGGEPLVFFLGTLTGSVIMLVTERIKRRE
jgi:Flp pilus assembly protein TadB